ncbi:radical SAM protein [Clostridium disporicum]|uniref:Putative heme d1 biosynthesis radical SAM protein NirJ2 n=1 Tax=Clostridium disporicum TaxID=84024 RepID=A0A174EX54_9CLOT|nr:radical SAM protein [Clostridium disporicum]CUO40565.1 putative heme d1 biosynthesis radical SAM protein NirJ2 [Clostridium disporicum]
MYIKWDITDKCNLNCKHCCVGGGKNNNKELTTNEVYDLINIFKMQGLKYIQFLGGEPFLKDNFLDILKYCNDSCIGIVITTNGTLINEETIKYINENIYVPIYIAFSLDGATKDTNNKIRGNNVFESCITNMELIHKNRKENLKFGINSTLTKINKKDIVKYFLLWKKYSIDFINFSFFYELGNGINNKKMFSLTEKEKEALIDEIFKRFSENNCSFDLDVPIDINKYNRLIDKYKCNLKYRSYNKSSCMILNNGVRIDSEGWVYSCDSHSKIDYLKNNNIITKDKLYYKDISNYLESNHYKYLKKYLESKLIENTQNDCSKKNGCISCPLEKISWDLKCKNCIYMETV